MAVGGPIAGLMIGLFFILVISLTSGSHKTIAHHQMTNVVQYALTISCAYCSFFVSEWILGSSGVLACVASGVFVGVIGKPLWVDPHGLHEAWHTLDWSLCSLLFVLSGVDSGSIIFAGKVELRHFAYILPLYVGVVVLGRFLMMFAFLPILSRIGYGFSWQGAVVASWGGLRGAVGIALAMVVKNQPYTDTKGNIILATACLACLLTHLVQGMTMKWLLGKLKLGSASEEKIQLFKEIHQQVKVSAQKNIDEAISARSKGPESTSDLSSIAAQVKTFCKNISKEVEGLSACPETLNDEYKRMVRQIFMQALRATYDEQIESGQLAKKGREALILRDSSDLAMDDFERLTDLDFLVEFMECTTKSAKLLSAFRSCLGYKKLDEECKCFLLTSLIEAHEHAQKLTALWIDDYDDAVVAESMEEIARAQEMLSKLSRELKDTVTAKIISAHVLEKEVKSIDVLGESGIIDENQMEELMHEVDKDMKGVH
jgi:sodium/hydrogen exchanger 10/11